MTESTESNETYGNADQWGGFGCEKCRDTVYLNENYVGLVLCEKCMDEVFPK